MGWKWTDHMSFHNAVDKFHIAKGPEGAKWVFISIGSGGKGSEYITLGPEKALELARYLTVEGHRVMEGQRSQRVPKAKTR